MQSESRRIVLAARPQGVLRAEDLRLEPFDPGEPADGQVLLRTLWLSLDPFIRLGVDSNPIGGANAVGVGQTMVGNTVSVVTASRHPMFKAGAYVEGRTGWCTHALSNGTGLRPVNPAAGALSAALGVLGMPGITAHTGVLTVGLAKEGETVVISAAAGAVGSLAGQIARIAGCRAVGIAGGAEKCRRVVGELKFDACVDYRAPDYPQRLREACHGGAALYFDNVGGAVSETVYDFLAPAARVAQCGFIAYYSDAGNATGPDRLPRLMRAIMAKGLTIRGFAGVLQAAPNARADLARWSQEGRLVAPETVVEGLERAPAAFAGVFAGVSHFGKLLVRVAERSSTDAPGTH